MKKFIYEHTDGQIKCEAANLDMKELAAEIAFLVNNLYSSLERQEPIAGKAFKDLVTMLLMPGAPTWEVQELHEGESSTLIMGVKK